MIDPVAVATQIYTGLQMIVSRRSELPKAPVVITVGRINGGVRENIIPEELTMAGTIRTLDSEMQKEVHAEDPADRQKIAESMGATADGLHRDEDAGHATTHPNSSKKCCPRSTKRPERKCEDR